MGVWTISWTIFFILIEGVKNFVYLSSLSLYIKYIKHSVNPKVFYGFGIF